MEAARFKRDHCWCRTPTGVRQLISMSNYFFIFLFFGHMSDTDAQKAKTKRTKRTFTHPNKRTFTHSKKMKRKEEWGGGVGDAKGRKRRREDEGGNRLLG